MCLWILLYVSVMCRLLMELILWEQWIEVMSASVSLLSGTYIMWIGSFVHLTWYIALFTAGLPWCLAAGLLLFPVTLNKHRWLDNIPTTFNTQDKTNVHRDIINLLSTSYLPVSPSPTPTQWLRIPNKPLKHPQSFKLFRHEKFNVTQITTFHRTDIKVNKTKRS